MRITGGVFRSREIAAPSGRETRPTSDRVREAMFSMLASEGMFEQPELRVLDLYAGSGALGFEALSRGASHAVFVERSAKAVRIIRDNVRRLGVEGRVEILPLPVARALVSTETAFDLVVMDPPYGDVRTPDFGQVLASAARALGPRGLLMLEHARQDAPESPILSLDRRRTHGDTVLSLYRARALSEDA